MEDGIDVTGLYMLALEWYVDNDGAMIDLDQWQKNTSKVSNDDLWIIHWNGHKAIHVGPESIPVLAAIGLGMPREQVLEVILHHKMTAEHLTNCQISDNKVENEDALIGTGWANQTMTAWHVINETIQSVSLDSEYAKTFASELWCESDRPDFSVAIAMSPCKEFWPATSIIRNKQRAIEDGVTTIPTPVHNMDSCGADFHHYSHDEIMDMLEHSGHFLEQVSAENGYMNQFAKSLLRDSERPNCHNSKRVIEAINSIENPEQVKRVSKILHRKLLDCDYPTSGVGLSTTIRISQKLDKYRYKSIRECMILKLSLIEKETLEDTTKSNPGLVSDSCFDDLLKNRELIFSKFGSDLLNVRPEDFRKGHFRALENIPVHCVNDQDLSAIDTHGLLTHVIQGWSAYRATTHLNFLKQPDDGLHKDSDTAVMSFLSWLTPQMDIDYTRLAELSSEAKAILAKSGLDIKKLPGMNQRDKGEVLMNSLGI